MYETLPKPISDMATGESFVSLFQMEFPYSKWSGSRSVGFLLFVIKINALSYQFQRFGVQ